MVWTNILSKAVLTSALVGGLVMSASPATARADDYGSCHRNVDKWEDRLERDIHRHGYDSRQANHDRHELAEAREKCEHRYGQFWLDHHDFDRDGYRR